MAETVLTYTLSDDKTYYIVSGCTSIADDGEVVIPDKYDDAENGEGPVTIINESAFENETALKKIKIGKNIQIIKKAAFRGCNQLTSIDIPDNVTLIGDGAFAKCAGLETVTIGRGVETIEVNAFDECTSLRVLKYNARNCKDMESGRSPFTASGNGLGISVTFGKDVERIPAYLFKPFYGAITVKANLASIQLKEGLKSIGNEAFYGCDNIKKVTIPSTVQKIGLRAFNPTTAVENFKLPDYDFLAFSFKGKHSVYDFGIYRVIDGDRYNFDLAPTMTDKTAENSTDGTFYFFTTHKQKNFNISFAFDGMTQENLQELKRWLDGKEMGDLYLDEEPYKIYTAKVTGQPTLKVIPFETTNASGEKIRIYKGEGAVTFTAFWPYAHTPDENTLISTQISSSGRFDADGTLLDSYDSWNYPTKEQWKLASGLMERTSHEGKNPGDVPAHFVLTKNGEFTTSRDNSTFKVGELSISLKIGIKIKNLIWDSKTGIVSQEYNEIRTPISYTGNSLGGIPVGGTDILELNGGTLNYHYWYY